MNSIKQRRLSELRLSNSPDLHVGGCVPFYFGESHIEDIESGLAEGFESTQKAAIAGHRVSEDEPQGCPQYYSVKRQLYGWNACKRQFSPRQLAIAEERLRSQGWLLPEVASAH